MYFNSCKFIHKYNNLSFLSFTGVTATEWKAWKEPSDEESLEIHRFAMEHGEYMLIYIIILFENYNLLFHSIHFYKFLSHENKKKFIVWDNIGNYTSFI